MTALRKLGSGTWLKAQMSVDSDQASAVIAMKQKLTARKRGACCLLEGKWMIALGGIAQAAKIQYWQLEVRYLLEWGSWNWRETACLWYEYSRNGASATHQEGTCTLSTFARQNALTKYVLHLTRTSQLTVNPSWFRLQPGQNIKHCCSHHRDPSPPSHCDRAAGEPWGRVSSPLLLTRALYRQR